MTGPALGRIERGLRFPRKTELLAIYERTGITPNQLLGLKNRKGKKHAKR